jgi:ubiquitin C-terminal hydrolase
MPSSSSKTASKKFNKKTVPGEAEFLHLIELAEYEVNVDPYRGIQYLVEHHPGTRKEKAMGDEIDFVEEKTSDLEVIADIADFSTDNGNDDNNNVAKSVSESIGWWRENCALRRDDTPNLNTEPTSSPAVDSSSGAVEIQTTWNSSEDHVRFVTGSSCPTLVCWTSRSMQDQQKKRFKRKRKSASDSTSSLACCFLGRRRYGNINKRCACDFNPFCLGTLGGAMDDILENWAIERTATQQKCNDRDDSIIVIDEYDSCTSDSTTKNFTPVRNEFAANMYSPRTSEGLNEVRKYDTVDSDEIRSYLLKILRDCTTVMAIDEGLDRLRQLHQSLIFLNPALSFEDAIVATDKKGEERNIRLSTPPGIENLGATCYLNTQLQCLAQNRVFVDGIISWRPSTDVGDSDRMSSVLTLFQDLLLRMNAGPLSIINTLEFSNALGLDHFEQQDPNEFSRLLFDRIHDSFQASSNNKSLSDLLPRLFQGVMVYETTCLECGTKSRRTEEFMDLNLPIVRPKYVDSESQQIFHKFFPNADTEVQYCLNHYCTVETLDGDNQYLCNSCACKRDAKRELAFQTLPHVLNVQVRCLSIMFLIKFIELTHIKCRQLCRYVFNREKLIKTKMSDRVLLPLYLDVHSLNGDRPNEKETHTYVLCAIMRHKGVSAYSGHYVAEAMDWLSGQWYEFNDHHVIRLEKGPSCSFDPSSLDSEEPSPLSNGTTLPNCISFAGSQDAYNMYYVEESFLAQCVIDNLKNVNCATSASAGSSSITNSIVSERSKYYDNLRQ